MNFINFRAQALVICLCLFAWPVLAVKTSIGQLTLQKQVLQQLKHIGPVDLKDTKVRQTADINGPLTVNQVEIRRLKLNGPLQGQKFSLSQGVINGPVDIQQSKVTDILTIFGPMNAQQSTFKDLMIATDHAHFKKCNIQSLTITKDNRAIPKIQQVILDQSQIHGTLMFESGRGEVILVNPQSRVKEVIGGRVIHQYQE